MSSRQRELSRQYAEVRSLTETLSAPLSAEDQTVQSMPDVSPTKWHRAHVTWFFETFVLEPRMSGYAPYDDRYRYLFNSYYEAVGPRHPRPERGLLSRPGIDEIRDYRLFVDKAMQEFLGAADDEPFLDLIELGLHHEQQHQELLLMDIKHVLSINPLRPPYLERAGGERAGGERAGGETATMAEHKHAPAAPGWFGHPGGLVAVGHDGEGFSFDNEQPRHEQYLEPFALASAPVTNANWLEFIADGGYQQPGLWLSDGWATVIAEQWEAPLYWWRDDDGWHQFTLHGACPVQADEPVCHVSYYEADAYARWSGARLPTEYEWEVVAGAQPFGGRFLDTEVLHPQPVMPDGRSPSGLFGDVWEWTASAYAPYPGFRPAAGAVGEYNGKFMVNQQVLRGGCCVTPAGHTRTTYRNFFPPGARWAFSGLRLAKDA